MMFHSSQDNQINVTWIGRQQPEHLMFHSSQDNQINVTQSLADTMRHDAVSLLTR